MPRVLKIFLVVLSAFFVGLFTFSPLVIKAQDVPANPVEKTDFEKQYDEYQEKVKVYDTLHQDYVVKRSQYMKFKTLTSQEDAFDATLKMLLARNDVIVSYFKSLKERLRESKDVTDETKARLNLTLDDEIAWLVTHQSTTSTAGTLDDLAADSATARARYTQRQQVIAYETLAAVSTGKVLGYQKRTEDLYDLLKKKIDEIRTETREGYTFSTEKFQILDRWLFDAETRITRAKQKNDTVSGLFSEQVIKQKGDIAARQYDTTLQILGQSQLFLKEANTFMGEVIREIKTAEN